MPWKIALLALVPALALADPMTGNWRITGDVVGNPLDETCAVKQEGPALSGSCTDAMGRSWELTGEVKGDSVTFQHGGDYEGTALTIVYRGTLSTPPALKGTVEVAPFGVSGDFSAAPEPAK